MVNVHKIVRGSLQKQFYFLSCVPPRELHCIVTCFIVLMTKYKEVLGGRDCWPAAQDFKADHPLPAGPAPWATLSTSQSPLSCSHSSHHAGGRREGRPRRAPTRTQCSVGMGSGCKSTEHQLTRRTGHCKHRGDYEALRNGPRLKPHPSSSPCGS